MHLPSFAYRLWQMPFARPKIAPLLEHPLYQQAETLCELGCGPGLNYPQLASKRYVGVDIDPEYIDAATRSYGPHFRLGDVGRGACGIDERFDLVLVHSVLHHLDDDAAVHALRQARELVAPGGSLHIFDMHLPPKWTFSGTLARMDEGKFVRPWSQWQQIFARSIGEYTRFDFPLRLFGPVAYRFFHLVTR